MGASKIEGPAFRSPFNTDLRIFGSYVGATSFSEIVHGSPCQGSDTVNDTVQALSRSTFQLLWTRSMRAAVKPGHVAEQALTAEISTFFATRDASGHHIHHQDSCHH